MAIQESVRPREPTTSARDPGVAPGLLSRSSWGAVFAGSVSAIAVLALLALLGLAIGFDAVNPTEENAPLSGLSTGTVVWLILTGIAAMLAGGYITGRLAGQPGALTSALHGTVMWAVATIVVLYLAGTAGGALVTGAAGVVRQAATMSASAVTQAAGLTGNAVQAIAQAAPDTLPLQVRQALERHDLTVRNARREIVDLLNRAGITSQDARAAAQATQNLAGDLVTSPSDAGEDVANYTQKLFGDSDAIISPEERQRVINLIQQRTGVSDQEIQRSLNRIETAVTSARNELADVAQAAQREAAQAAQAATDALSGASWTAFFTLLFGLAAAAGGAVAGSPNRVRFDRNRS